MPQQIKIVPNTPPTATQPGKFSPQTANSYAGDSITWFNGDSQPHWPAPNVANRTAWVRQEIQPGNPGNGALAPMPNNTTSNSVTSTSPAILTVVAPGPNSGDKVTLAYTGANAQWKAAVQAVPPNSEATAKSPTECTVAGFNALGLPAFLSTDKITVTIQGNYTIKYICALHKDEEGRIIVGPKPTPQVAPKPTPQP
jgi:plastocyanin